MPKTKPYREVVKILEADGWIYMRTNGSHEIYGKNGKSCPIKNSKKDIPSGTLSNISRITGLKF